MNVKTKPHWPKLGQLSHFMVTIQSCSLYSSLHPHPPPTPKIIFFSSLQWWWQEISGGRTHSKVTALDELSVTSLIISVQDIIQDMPNASQTSTAAEDLEQNNLLTNASVVKSLSFYLCVLVILSIPIVYIHCGENLLNAQQTRKHKLNNLPVYFCQEWQNCQPHWLFFRKPFTSTSYYISYNFADEH